MPRPFFQVFCLVVGWYCSMSAPLGYGWSERGHNMIARVAARLSCDELGADAALSKVLLDKELMLGHLANVPDIVWKNTDAHTAEVNFPTHFFDIDALVKQPVLDKLPTTVAGLEALGGHQVKAEKFGTAPFRVQQMYVSMRTSFAEAKAAQNKKELVAAVNHALLVGGLLAHFVGDLAQPLHTTDDYDGYDAGQGGLHAYFEGAVVSAMDLKLSDQVMQVAKKRRQIAALRKEVSKLKPERPELHALLLAYALAIDSFHTIPLVEAVDKKVALVKASSKDRGLKIPAVRRAPSLTATAFQPLVRDRLALGAELLSYLWISAWREGGSPDLSTFQSFSYPVAPLLIETDYMTAQTTPVSTTP